MLLSISFNGVLKCFLPIFSEFNSVNPPSAGSKRVQFNVRSKSEAIDDLNNEKSARSFKQGRRKSSADAMKGRMFDMIFLGGKNYISPSQEIEELSVASLEQKHKMRPPAQIVVKADIEDNER